MHSYANQPNRLEPPEDESCAPGQRCALEKEQKFDSTSNETPKSLIRIKSSAPILHTHQVQISTQKATSGSAMRERTLLLNDSPSTLFSSSAHTGLPTCKRPHNLSTSSLITAANAHININHQRSKQQHLTLRIVSKLFNLIIVTTLLSHLDQLNHVANLIPSEQSLVQFQVLDTQLLQTTLLPFALPKIILAGAIECALDGDCGKDKICHENKCICTRDRPIEDQDRCLTLALLNEECFLSEQCLGNSLCVAGICSCGNDAISFFNPSSKIFYCHPKRRLNEECNYDSQCPSNSYCSTSKFGCLCQNGFAPATVSNAGVESLECLPKTCSNSSACESEYHQCEESKCKCLATHFDPETARCYRFGSTGGKETDLSGNLTDAVNSGDNNLYSIMKDLTENSDRMWLVLIILISLSILLLLLISMLLRKYYLGYCWTAHKKEYEPNTKNPPKNGYFNKNSINNKSFRQKNGEVEDDDNDSSAGADKSSLVTGNKKVGLSQAAFMTSAADKNRQQHSYIKVNMNESQQEDSSDPLNGNNRQQSKQYYKHQVVSPLKTSTSTPV